MNLRKFLPWSQQQAKGVFICEKNIRGEFFSLIFCEFSFVLHVYVIDGRSCPQKPAVAAVALEREGVAPRGAFHHLGQLDGPPFGPFEIFGGWRIRPSTMIVGTRRRVHYFFQNGVQVQAGDFRFTDNLRLGRVLPRPGGVPNVEPVLVRIWKAVSMESRGWVDETGPPRRRGGPISQVVIYCQASWNYNQTLDGMLDIHMYGSELYVA